MPEQIGMDEQTLWSKYCNLSEEMNKFLDKDDVDTFIELLRQRNYFEERIQRITPVYAKSPAGQAMLKKQFAVNKVMLGKVQLWLNKSRLNRSISRSYESLGQSLNGIRIDGRG